MLIACKECGKEISDKAKICPHCGCPVKKKGKGFAITSLVLGIIACVYSVPVFMMSVLSYAAGFAVTGMAVYIMVFAVLSLIFGLVSHFKGCKLKKKIAGMVLSIIAIIILTVAIIITLV